MVDDGRRDGVHTVSTTGIAQTQKCSRDVARNVSTAIAAHKQKKGANLVEIDS